MSIDKIKKYLSGKMHLRISRLVVLGVFLLGAGSLLGQNSSETGLYNIRNYSAKEYGLPPQNFAIVQDSRGVLFFGNNSGILEYDGENWDTIQTPQEEPIRSLTIDSKGVIYVGGTGEIGYLAPDANGRMRYISLLDSIKNKSERDFGPVWTCYATKENKVYFQASNRLFMWDGKKMKGWEPETKPGASFHLMFYLNNSLYIREKEIGMMKMMNGTLNFIQGGDLFAQNKVYFMQPFRKDEILLNMEGRGLFTMAPADFSTRIQDAGQLPK